MAYYCLIPENPERVIWLECVKIPFWTYKPHQPLTGTGIEIGSISWESAGLETQDSWILEKNRHISNFDKSCFRRISFEDPRVQKILGNEKPLKPLLLYDIEGTSYGVDALYNNRFVVFLENEEEHTILKNFGCKGLGVWNGSYCYCLSSYSSCTYSSSSSRFNSGSYKKGILYLNPPSKNKETSIKKEETKEIQTVNTEEHLVLYDNQGFRYRKEVLYNRDVVVYIENKEQHDTLRKAIHGKGLVPWYGAYCYSLNKNTYCSSSAKFNPGSYRRDGDIKILYLDFPEGKTVKEVVIEDTTNSLRSLVPKGSPEEDNSEDIVSIEYKKPKSNKTILSI